MVVVQWARRWTANHSVVQPVGSNTPGDVFQIRLSKCFHFSFMLRHVNFSDIAIQCNRPNNCCEQNLKCFDEPLFSLGMSSRNSNNNSVNCLACLICSSKFSLTWAHNVDVLKWF